MNATRFIVLAGAAVAMAGCGGGGQSQADRDQADATRATEELEQAAAGLARYKRDGTLDPTFGGNRKVRASGLGGAVVGAKWSGGRGANAAPAGRARAPGVTPCRPTRPRYRTYPRWRPAAFCLMKRAGRTAAGLLFVTPRARGWWPRGSEQHGIMILNNKGQVVWYSHRPWVARDLKVVRYNGRRILAFYQGDPPGSPGRSHYALLDDRYRLVRRVYAARGSRTDTHELQLTRHGTAYIFARRRVWHAPVRDHVIDWAIQEIDLASGRLLFEWRSLDHVPPSASYLPRPSERVPPRRSPRNWDYFHGNSIDVSRLPTILVSARNTSAVYAISRRTGRILWTLGGKRDDFGIVRNRPAWQFCAQHDARWLPNGDISLFDNGGLALYAGRACPVHGSRVEVFRLNGRAKTARRVRTISSRPSSEGGTGLRAWAMGSARRLPNGNTLVDWGTTGRITEVAPDGDVEFGLRLARYSYRVIRAPWEGRPAGRPRIAVACAGGRLRVWMSWNGATQVRSWRIFAIAPRGGVRRVADVRFGGLETGTAVMTRAPYVQAAAVGADGRLLARSRVAPTRCP